MNWYLYQCKFDFKIVWIGNYDNVKLDSMNNEPVINIITLNNMNQ